MCIFLCFFSIFLVVCLRACFLLPKRRKKMHRPIKVQEGHLFGRRDTHDFVRNSEVSLRTGLAPASGRITRGRNAILGHVARLPDNIPVHQAMLRQVELSVGRPQDPTRKRPPGRPRTKWTDQLRRDNNNVPIATLWRQATGRGHSRATLRSEPTTR